ncbi:MAG: TetR/AcrR family transcriptional regulator [Lachnospiraceae bacterium]|nr:TetR/AcrR family transcriptional regulator [Lachnospiraceae bacterium]
MDFNKFSLNNFTKKNQHTRMCIGDAIIELMKDNDFKHIKISDITKKAGVSRMTFYTYYHTKEEVVEDYLQEVIHGYIKLSYGKLSTDFPSYDNILMALNYFNDYRKFFLGMSRAGLFNMLIDAVNKYMDDYIIPNYNVSPYEIYYCAGGIINMFLKWEEADCAVSAEDIAKCISAPTMVVQPQ